MGVNILILKYTINIYLKYILKVCWIYFLRQEYITYSIFSKILQVYAHCIFCAKICEYLYIIYFFFFMYIAHLWCRVMQGRGPNFKITENNAVNSVLFHCTSANLTKQSFWEQHIVIISYSYVSHLSLLLALIFRIKRYRIISF